jgi:ABC-type Fe3+/spermidine/putrescine transport system ATPase subunit
LGCSTEGLRSKLSDRIVVVNAGAIEQVGSPSDIYNRPRTPFVASFVGTLNTLQGVVVDPAEGVIREAPSKAQERARRGRSRYAPRRCASALPLTAQTP